MGKQFGKHGQTIRRELSLSFRKIPQTWHGMSTCSCLVASKIQNVELFNLRSARTPDKCSPSVVLLTKRRLLRENLGISLRHVPLLHGFNGSTMWTSWSCSTVALHADSEKHWRKEGSLGLLIMLYYAVLDKVQRHPLVECSTSLHGAITCTGHSQVLQSITKLVVWNWTHVEQMGRQGAPPWSPKPEWRCHKPLISRLIATSEDHKLLREQTVTGKQHN